MRKNQFFKKLPTPFSINIYVNMTCFLSIDVDFYTFTAKTLATDHSVFQLKHFFLPILFLCLNTVTVTAGTFEP